MSDMAAKGEQSPGWDRRRLVLSGLLAGAAGIALALRPRAADQKVTPGTIERIVPLTIGRYRYVSASGLVVAPQSELREATYADVLARAYSAPGERPVMLLIAYGSAQDAGLAVHRPEECYPAVGFDISPVRTVPLSGPVPAGSRACFLTARRDDRVEHVYFWVRVGSVFPTSPVEQRLAIVRDNLAGRLPFGLLARLSVIGGSADEALAIAEQFNAAMLNGIDAAGREVLLGHA
ncbi:exosortase C-terminal domain/associated protein EpsI [Sphingobium sp. CAP-1]|uniref:exosortase C-terminal domain/associated protein EpsI n=1 Tax=Sphingobium sp. CAP-1 TaxID=2676077 RepID=UPI0012BB2AAB|nr:exosortase C-terminal domain/associated protein EpsI [Sphingobium sp. CAP-1]QGP78189.1 EpsI family protein [Sphingobium sp. CAP-1]